MPDSPDHAPVIAASSPDAKDDAIVHLTVKLHEMQTALFFLTGRPTLCGEWSMALPWTGPIVKQMRTMSAAKKFRLRRAFMERQVTALTRNGRMGGYFWTWHAPRVDGKPDLAAEWSFQNQIMTGVLVPGQWAATRHS